MKYKVGDKVRVRKDLSDDKRYYSEDKKTWDDAAPPMIKYAGKIVTIAGVNDKVGKYDIEEDNKEWNWTDEMFEDVSKFKVGDKVIAANNAPYGITTNGWIGKVTKVIDDNFIVVKGGKIMTGVSVRAKYFSLFTDKKIVITTDGTTTTAKLYEGKKFVKSAEAKCSHDDEFDFNLGATIALSRLTGLEHKVPELKIAEEKPEPKYNGKVVCVDRTNNKDIYTVGKIYQFVDGSLTNDKGGTYNNFGRGFASFKEFADWTSAKFIEVVE